VGNSKLSELPVMLITMLNFAHFEPRLVKIRGAMGRSLYQLLIRTMEL